jgi:carbon storage regulator CsrA
MLVLSRKSQESVVIGGNSAFSRLLKITVLDINGGKVQLGFEIDADIPVHRKEVWERLRMQDATDGVNEPPLFISPG